MLVTQEIQEIPVIQAIPVIRETREIQFPITAIREIPVTLFLMMEIQEIPVIQAIPVERPVTVPERHMRSLNSLKILKAGAWQMKTVTAFPIVWKFRTA